jgi:hypothetical protein
MRLTWKDLVTTVFMAGIVFIYTVFLQGTSWWLISSARGTTTAVLVLGIVGGCALGAAGDLYTEKLTRGESVLRTVATLLGITALVAAIVGLITGGTVPLAILVGATLALWLVATFRHAFAGRLEPAAGVRTRDTHEAIHPDRVNLH